MLPARSEFIAMGSWSPVARLPTALCSTQLLNWILVLLRVITVLLAGWTNCVLQKVLHVMQTMLALLCQPHVSRGANDVASRRSHRSDSPDPVASDHGSRAQWR